MGWGYFTIGNVTVALWNIDEARAVVIARAERKAAEQAAREAQQPRSGSSASTITKEHEEDTADESLPPPPDVQHENARLLSLAIRAQQLSRVCAILDNEVIDVAFRDECQRTLLHLGVMLRDLNITEKLVDKGIEINAQDDLGYTALHYAIMQKGDMGLIKCLIGRGADASIKSRDSYTSYQILQNLHMVHSIQLHSMQETFWERIAFFQQTLDPELTPTYLPIDSSKFILPYFIEFGDEKYWYELVEPLPPSLAASSIGDDAVSETSAPYFPPAYAALDGLVQRHWGGVDHQPMRFHFPKPNSKVSVVGGEYEEVGSNPTEVPSTITRVSSSEWSEVGVHSDPAVVKSSRGGSKAPFNQPSAAGPHSFFSTSTDHTESESDGEEIRSVSEGSVNAFATTRPYFKPS